MKKLLAIAIVLALLACALCACSGNNSTETDSKNESVSDSVSDSVSESVTGEDESDSESATSDVETPTESESATNEVETPTESESATNEVETPTESESATNDVETPTESESATNDVETPTESVTDPEEETDPEDETNPDASDALKNVLAHKWYEYDFTEDGGLTEIMHIDMAAEHLDATTLDGWTKVSVLYIPTKKPDGKKFGYNDYIGVVGVMRGDTDSFPYTLRFNLCLNVFGSANAALFPTDNVEYVDIKADYKGGYAMFVETYTASEMCTWLNGERYIRCVQSYEKTGIKGELSLLHKHMYLNAFGGVDTTTANLIDLYAKFGIKTMYTVAYAYAASDDVVRELYTYFDRESGTLKGLPEVEVLPLSFEDPEGDVSFKPDETPSNINVVKSYPYVLQTIPQGGLKNAVVVRIRDLWDTVKKTKDWGNGPALEGITTVGLYYIPEGEYTSNDWIGMMMYHDYDANGWMGNCMRYNLGTGLVNGIGDTFTALNSVVRPVFARGWVCIVTSFDGAIAKAWINDELVFVGSVEGEMYASYGINHREHLHEMVINGYVAEREDHYNTIENSLVDLYEAYGIYMMKADVYAYPANEQAAHDFYVELMN